MNSSMKHINIPIFVPHRGCRHACVFCNQRTITGCGGEVTGEQVYAVVEEHLATARPDAEVEVAFFGGSFTAIDPAQQEELLGAVQPYIAQGRVRGIRCSTRPDCIDGDVIKRLLHYGVKAVELGVQSTDEQVLALSGRGHTAEDAFAATALLRGAGLELGLQMMVGLPGDTPEKTLQTARDIIAMRPDTVRIYPTLVLEGTSLYDRYREGLYRPLTIEAAVEQCTTLLQMFAVAGVRVIRVGLATTDGVNADTAIGPYHPALRELAEGRLARRAMEAYLAAHPADELAVCCRPADVSRVVGHKRENALYLRDHFGARLTVRAEAAVPYGLVIICVKNQKHVLPIL